MSTASSAKGRFPTAARARLRARLALDIVRERLAMTGVAASEPRFDVIGVNALCGDALSASHAEPYEARIRVSGRCTSAVEAARIGNEIETLYTNGPAGGGVTKATREVIAVQSVLLPRGHVQPVFEFVEANDETA